MNESTRGQKKGSTGEFEVDANDGTQRSNPSDELTQNLPGNSSDDTSHLSECNDESKGSVKSNLDNTTFQPDSSTTALTS